MASACASARRSTEVDKGSALGIRRHNGLDTTGLVARTICCRSIALAGAIIFGDRKTKISKFNANVNSATIYKRLVSFYVLLNS